MTMESRRHPEIKFIFKKMLQFMDSRHCQIICDHNLAEKFSLMERQLNNTILSFVTDDYSDDEFVTFLSFRSRISPEGDAIFNLFYEAVTFLARIRPIINLLKLGQLLRIFKSLDRKNVLERMRRMDLIMAGPERAQSDRMLRGVRQQTTG